jgi:hypothetical protein
MFAFKFSLRRYPSGKNRMQRMMGDGLGGMLVKPWVKCVVIGCAAAIAAGGFAGCAMLKVGTDGSCSPRHLTYCEPSFIEFVDFL